METCILFPGIRNLSATYLLQTWKSHKSMRNLQLLKIDQKPKNYQTISAFTWKEIFQENYQTCILHYVISTVKTDQNIQIVCVYQNCALWLSILPSMVNASASKSTQTCNKQMLRGQISLRKIQTKHVFLIIFLVSFIETQLKISKWMNT